MAKVSVAGICREVLDNCDRHMNLAELTAACTIAGLDVSEAQVYAGLQSMASTGKCDRGPEARTWVKLGAGRPKGEPKPDAEPRTSTKRTKIKEPSQGVYPPAVVLERIVAKLGEPSARPKDRLAFCMVLLGEWDADHILNRAYIVLQQEPSNWFTYMQGPNTVVGFTI